MHGGSNRHRKGRVSHACSTLYWCYSSNSTEWVTGLDPLSARQGVLARLHFNLAATQLGHNRIGQCLAGRASRHYCSVLNNPDSDQPSTWFAVTSARWLP